MKKLVMFGILMVVASLLFAQSPQTQKKTKTFTAKTVSKTRPAPSPPPLRKENTEGVLARAARGGNPLQMLNPKAPAVYGRAEDNVFLDPETGKWKGIKLLTINF
ncbi:MAG TPA: hypothetical protein VG103_03260 [Chthoniobacterales bacterium]|jgi:hypothetical protein|nr:hypothetical protein [Chthoniobacterales bacterium]